MEENAPKPAPEMQRVIDLLNGRWNLAVTYEANDYNPEGGTAKGIETSRPGPGGFSLVFESGSSDDGEDAGDFAALGIIEWSPTEKVYLLHWLNSMSPTGAFFKGNWEDGDLVFNGRESMLGPEMASRHSITKIREDAFTYTVDMGPTEQELKRIFTIEYTKAK